MSEHTFRPIGARYGSIAAQEQSGRYVQEPLKNLHGSVSTQVIHVDSRSRNLTLHPRASDFVVRLPKPLHNVVSVRLLSATIPILEPTIHAPIPAETNPYIVLRSDVLGSSMDVLRGAAGPDSGAVIGGASIDAERRNAIADNGAWAIIPLIPQIAAQVGGDTVQYAVWSEQNNQPAVKYFRPPLAMIKEMRFHLVQWGQSTDVRTKYDTYALPAESAVPSNTDPSGLVPQNNVSFLFEVTSMQ
jgi:hypothetical protein